MKQTIDTLEEIELGSCPTCGGPAQFIADDSPAGMHVRHVDLRTMEECDRIPVPWQLAAIVLGALTIGYLTAKLGSIL